jgi:hypothetical protein
VPGEKEGFRFLTMVEFNRLSRRDKALYLERAVEEITRQQLGDDVTRFLFKDLTPAPQPSPGSPKCEESTC